MQYQALYAELKDAVNYQDDCIPVGSGLEIHNFTFQSRIRYATPEPFDAGTLPVSLPDARRDVQDNLARLISVKDADIAENHRFRYHVILPDGERARRVIIMFHGFNERQWAKYLPWAAFLARQTGHAVILFPMAFHMNRAPEDWTDIRAMNRLSKVRRSIHPAVIGCSLSNVAISTRLYYRPERFIWSGLQTYYDVVDLVEAIRADRHPAFQADAAIDFFSYSVGSFLGQTLMMTNDRGFFTDSKYAMFCGGAVFNRLSPVSKFILDSEASVKLYSYLVEHLESHFRSDTELCRVLNGDILEGRIFRSLLNYRDNLKFREDRLRAIQDRLYAVALADDEVVPPYEVVHSLRGSRQDIDIPVEIVDFPYPYRHEDPFPFNAVHADAVDAAFRSTFDKIAAFLARP